MIEFPLGLIGLGGLRYTLLDRNPGSGFLWLHAIDDPALALPVVSPLQFFADFALEIAPEDRERTGIEDIAGAHAVRDRARHARPARHHRQPARPAGDPRGRGYQVINTSEHAPLQAPLFAVPAGAGAEVARPPVAS